MEDKDTEYEYEEFVVLVELNGIIDSNFLLQEQAPIQILGIASDKPILQIGHYTFSGEYDDTLGTVIAYKQEKTVNSEGKETVDYKYLCKTDKKLSMRRVFIQEKDSPEAKKENLKKTPKKSEPQSQLNTSVKQNVKHNDMFNKSEDLGMEVPKTSEPQTNNKTVTNVTANKTSDHVIKSKNGVQHHIVNSKKSESIPVTMPNVPDITKSESVIQSPDMTSVISVPSAAVEEDAHHMTATENVVAQWTEEENAKTDKAKVSCNEVTEKIKDCNIKN